LLESAADFSDDNCKEDAAPSVDVESSHAKIGELILTIRRAHQGRTVEERKEMID
jgi:hypothetical protein